MESKIKQHWETIYKTRQPHEVSWTQDIPVLSLEFIHKQKVPKDARIIDVGGGDSKLVDTLIEQGYNNITVLDISEAAIERAKERLGKKSENVTWIVSDVLDFHPLEMYDVWHDRAAFHFQTNSESVQAYLEVVKRSVKGIVIVGTFSTDGPQKCSGLNIQQYNEQSMKTLFEQNSFHNIECKREDHITPKGAVQNFVFCSFLKAKPVS